MDGHPRIPMGQRDNVLHVAIDVSNVLHYSFQPNYALTLQMNALQIARVATDALLRLAKSTGLIHVEFHVDESNLVLAKNALWEFPLWFERRSMGERPDLKLCLSRPVPSDWSGSVLGSLKQKSICSNTLMGIFVVHCAKRVAEYCNEETLIHVYVSPLSISSRVFGGSIPSDCP